MSISDETGGELQALTPELIETINGVQHNVLKSCYISILKRLAKSAPNIDLYVRIRNGKVAKIRHVLDDFNLVIEE